MIKFLAERVDGGVTLGIGLSEMNVKALKEGRPIKMELGELINESQARKLEVFIFYGETEDSMQKELQKFIGSTTSVIDRRREN